MANEIENEMKYDPSIYRGFYVFLDPEEFVAVIPSPWMDCFGKRLSSSVEFVDRKKNSFNIKLSKQDMNYAFTTGIKELLEHYVLKNGAWMRLFYLGGSQFHVDLFDRDLKIAIDYHQVGDHYDFGWSDDDPVEDLYDSGPENDEMDGLICSEMEIFSSHLKKNRKELPCEFVSNAILPEKPSYCVLRDQDGRRYFCEYQFNYKRCALTVGWLDFVKDNNLYEGTVVKVGIRVGDPSVIHAQVHKLRIPKKAKVVNQSAGVKIKEEEY